MTDLFGNYKSQSTLQLQRIDSSKYPDTNKDFEANVRRLNGFVDYISGYLQQMQKGVDQANTDPITQIRNFATDLGQLLGGGELLYGINLGDLQYLLPALGAMFGFDTSQPFPLNLLYAAEHFLLGYIIPLDSWAFAIEDIIDGWAVALGLDPDFIAAIHELLETIQEVTNDLGGLLNDILGLFGIFDISDSFGPFGEIWHSITQLLGSFDLQDLGNLTDPILSALAPWVHTVAQFIDWLDQIIKSFSGGLTNLQGILNFSSLFTPIIDFMSGLFDPNHAWESIVNLVLLPLNLLIGPDSPFAALNIFGLLGINNLPLLPISHLSDTATANLLVEPGFNNSGVFSPGTGWSWDNSTGHTTTGSMRTTAGGAGHDRRLDSIPVPVAEGQHISVAVWVFWTLIVYSSTTTPIRLYILPYSNGVLQTPVVIAAPVSPATSTVSWQQLTGTYTVPAGIDDIKLSFQVPGNMTSGSVWFDDADLHKTGSIPQSWITNLLDSLGGLGDFIQNVVDAVLSGIRGFPVIGGFIADIIEDLIGWHDDTDATAAQASDAFLGVQATQNIIESTTTGVPTTTATDTTVQNALTGQTAVIVNQGATIEAILALQNAATNSGISLVEAFEYMDTNSLDPTLWDRFFLEGSSSGGVIATTDGHNAGMVILDGSVATTEFDLYKGPNRHTLTDYQRVATTCNTQMSGPGFLDNRASHIASYCRCNDSGDTWVRGLVTTQGQCFIQYRVAGGTITDLVGPTGGFTTPVPSPSQPLAIEAGVGGLPRAFRVWVGNNIVHSGTDTGLVTSLGSSFRGYGWGQRQDHGLPPGTVTQIAISDNTPAPVIGSHFHMYRNNTGAVAFSAGAKLPDDYFDSIPLQSPDYTASLGTNNGVTVRDSGTYRVKLVVTRNSVNAGENQRYALGIYNGSTLVAYGGWIGELITETLTGGGPSYQGNWRKLCLTEDIYCNAGDTIYPGYQGVPAFSGVGSSDGFASFMKIVRVS